MNPGTPDPQRLVAYVKTLAASLEIAIDPAWEASVVENVRGLLSVAGVLMEFDLPDGLEAGPVFEP